MQRFRTYGPCKRIFAFPRLASPMMVVAILRLQLVRVYELLLPPRRIGPNDEYPVAENLSVNWSTVAQDVSFSEVCGALSKPDSCEFGRYQLLIPQKPWCAAAPST